jgi:clan AA aspartic protease
MISGIVTSDYEAIIPLEVRGPSGQKEKIEAVVDTGYNGWLSLRPALITELELSWRRKGRAILADGNETVFDVYEGTVTWDRRVRRVAVDAADTDPLVGMALLRGYELKMQVRTSGKVTIKSLSK